MEGFQHNPYLWFGVGIPVCLIVAIIVGRAVGNIVGNIDNARKQEQSDMVKTARIDVQTGKVTEFTEEDK